jgi:hypothetical protein
MFTNFIENYLSEYKWTRKYLGGHWERWFVDRPVGKSVWHKVKHCSVITGIKPTPLCQGTSEVCEDYTDKKTRTQIMVLNKKLDKEVACHILDIIDKGDIDPLVLNEFLDVINGYVNLVKMHNLDSIVVGGSQWPLWPK